ncbi:MAG: Holliday junction branch migration protein RuvA [Oleispira antarctica]|uniref:Holliday junction branch migration complex subunit RuvA n=1 Tax=Oleispira antarctica RB-8 TaxID=698738 RepID=R4YUI6_OLEAN|nr:Holliday junction branch migration protein RuvA [Oleispira antarctica]MBQ0792006.1 Holliday junction branch migration protein RuvA [Oleispira antarctica]CCK76714.1 Holliday junction ATP-dependent DNA helicase RuvA [Oleispira antarctica RB-8]
MIGRLSGVLIEKQAPDLLIDVNGVGYEVQAPLSSFLDIGALGSKITLLTHLVVREDAQLLYGFSDKMQRTMFRTLIKVSGVGPKLALGILSSMDADTFARCIQNHEVAALTKLPGVGKKTAERLIVEMQDRLKEWQTQAPLWAAVEQSDTANRNHLLSEAEAALISLGYKPQEATKMLSKMPTDIDSSEDMIRRALKGMM